MNYMPLAKRAQIIGFVVEGMSLRSAARLADCSLNTVTKLLVDIGTACAAYQDQALRNLPCKRVQCDEVWSFCYAKEKNLPEDKRGLFGYGDIWTWTAICADTKLIACWMVGSRTMECGQAFINDLASRLANRIQLTTDGHKIYIDAVENAFAGNIDFAMLVKIYGDGGPKGPERKYSAAKYKGAKRVNINGAPDKAHVSTSYVERQNLSMRMGMRRFTRLTNGFSKKVDNHMHAIALYFMHYNFGRIHQTLRVTPAMEAGMSDHVWTLEEIAGLVPEPIAKPRGPYKKRLNLLEQNPA